MKLTIFIALFISTALVFAVTPQYSSFPINVFEGEAATPVAFIGEDYTYIGVGGSDSSFHIVTVEHPTSIRHLLTLEGPVRRTAAVTYDGRFAVQTTNGLLYVINTSGIVMPGFPVDLGGESQYSSPVVLPDNTIIVVAGSSIYAVSPTGDRRHIADFDSEYGAVASPAAGDIDGDGVINVIVPGWSNLYAFSIEDGSLVESFPIELPEGWHYSYSSPVIVDLQGNGNLEVVIGIHQITGYNWGAVMAARAGVGPLMSYPLAITTNASWIYSTVAPVDIDDDGYPEKNILSVNGYVYSMNANFYEGLFKASFYVTSGVLEGGLVMISSDGDRLPEFHFLSGDTARIVRRKADGFRPDTLDFFTAGRYGMTAPTIFQHSDGNYLITSATKQGQLNLWTLAEDVPFATPKWLHYRGSIHGDGVHPEPPESVWVKDTGDYFRIDWSPPAVSAFPPDSYSVYRPDPADLDRERLEKVYSGTDMRIWTTVAFDSAYIYVTAHYPNGTESTGRRSLVYRGQSVFEEITHNQSDMPTIMPNPFNSSCRIITENHVEKVVITDINGRVIKETSNTSISFDDETPSGIYLFHIYGRDGIIGEPKRATFIK